MTFSNQHDPFMYETGLPAGQQPVTLFCFPYSGASAGMYREWPRGIPNTIRVYPVELPGHGRRMGEPLQTEMHALVDDACRAILHETGRPFALFGHSMGALLSLELARYLRRVYGREPMHLFVSGHPAPHLPDLHPPIYNLPDPEFVEHIRALHGASESFYENPELLEIFLPILRADFTVCGTYTVGSEAPLSCPITALGGLLDEETPRPALEAWHVYTQSVCRVRMFPGDHFFLNQHPQPVIDVVARALMDGALDSVMSTEDGCSAS